MMCYCEEAINLGEFAEPDLSENDRLGIDSRTK